MATYFKLLIILVALLAYATPVADANTLSVPVELEVPATTISLEGRASPNALVIIGRSGSTIASVNANALGVFNATFLANPGINNLSVFFKDSANLESKTIFKSISAQSQQDTSSSVFLSPTISTPNRGGIKLGSIIQVRGSTVPNATVKLSVDFGSKVYTTQSNSLGEYEYLINSLELGEGSRSASVTSQKDGLESSTSKDIKFNIVGEDQPSTPDLVTSPEILPPPLLISPPDGSTIDGNKVTINGESLPNAQINIYQNNELIGSVFANEQGKWSFEYVASSSPVTLTFEACVDGRCSVFSKSITLNFSLPTSCKVDFSLEEYRFWGLSVDEKLRLNVNYVGNGTTVVNWGDGTEERFSINNNPNLIIEKSYQKTGNYNGSIKISNGDCVEEKFFSVSVNSTDSNNNRLIWIAIILLLIVILYEFSRRDKQKA